MESETAAPDRQAFVILELIDAYRETLWFESDAGKSHGIESLLDDLEDVYRLAMEPWSIHRTTPGELAQEDFYRWHKYMFPPAVFQEAQWKFREIVTTSRFSVEDVPSVLTLQQGGALAVGAGMTPAHVVSLAVLACIQFALEELSSIEFLDPEAEADHLKSQIDESRGLHRQAEAWLLQLAALNFSQIQFDTTQKIAKLETSRKATAAAKLPRRAKGLTVQAVALYFSGRNGEKWEVIRRELAEQYSVSESTIDRRYREAKKRNLLS